MNEESGASKSGTLRSALAALLSVCGWGMFFLVAYVLLTLLFGILVEFHVDYFTGTTWADSSVLAVTVLYVSVIAMIFVSYGVAVSVRGKGGLWRQAVAVSSVALLSLIIWLPIYFSVKGSTSELGGAPWFLFSVYSFWAMPVTELLRYYIPDPGCVKVIGLLLSFVPTVSAWIGMGLVPIYRSRISARKLLARAALVPVGLAVVFVISLLLPRQQAFSLESFPSIDGATAAIPFAQITMQRLTGINKPYIAEKAIRFNTTHNAYVNLIEKRADLILAAGPSAEEEQLAKQNGVQMKLTPLGKDAFIFLVHRENGISGLSVQQIQDIYAGKVQNWSEVGGDDNRIVAFQREANSGSQTYMESKVMKGLKLADPPMERKSLGMGGLIDAVADYSNSKQAVGYSFYYFASQMYKRDNVRFVPINGVEPSHANIRNGQYPYTALLYAVTRSDEPADSPAGRLLTWLQSEEGRRAVADGGFVPLTEE